MSDLRTLADHLDASREFISDPAMMDKYLAWSEQCRETADEIEQLHLQINELDGGIAAHEICIANLRTNLEQSVEHGAKGWAEAASLRAQLAKQSTDLLAIWSNWKVRALKAEMQLNATEMFLDNLFQIMQHARGFISTHAKMHSDDIKRYDDMINQLANKLSTKDNSNES